MPANTYFGAGQKGPRDEAREGPRAEAYSFQYVDAIARHWRAFTQSGRAQQSKRLPSAGYGIWAFMAGPACYLLEPGRSMIEL
jgi:hypothetical protein